MKSEVLRIDKYLQIVGIIKSRSLAKEACEKGYVYLNGTKAKASKEVKTGDKILLDFPLRKVEIRILEVPKAKSISKKERKGYFEILRDERKEIL